MNKQHVRTIFTRLQEGNPNPTTELIYRNHFELLIAVILSAQATDKSVNLATAKLFQRAGSAQEMAQMSEDEIISYIKTIGLYRNKAKNILASAKILAEQYAGVVPDSRKALEALPGVGRKTANVILNTAFGHPTIAVDTHIFRVARRIGLAKGNTVQAVEKALLKTVPQEFRLNAHHWLILHGRYICKARTPLCGKCVLYDLCQYAKKTT